MKTLARLAPLVFLIGVLPASAQQTPRIPLRKDLTIVTAINRPGIGDSESIKTFIRATNTEVQLKFSWEAPASNNDDNPLAALLGGGNQPKKTNADGKQVQQVKS